MESLLEEQDKIDLVTNKYIFKKQIGKNGKNLYLCYMLKMEKDNNEEYEFKSVCVKKLTYISNDEEEAKNALRELSFLSFIRHPKIIKLIDIIKPDEEDFDEIYMVMDKQDYNLKQIIKSKNFDYLNDPKYKNFIKSIIHQILQALVYLHSSKIMHRNLKPSNILISKNAQIKICDFELARTFKEIKQFKGRNIRNEINNLDYAAPELFSNEESGFYNEKVDLWSVGCIMLELYLRKTSYFSFDEKLENGYDQRWKWFYQLKKIFSVFGMPERKDIERTVRNVIYSDEILEHLEKSEFPVRDFEEIFPQIKDKDALDLLKKLLEFNYKKRISAKEALNHPYFDDLRKKTQNFEIEIYNDNNEFESNILKDEDNNEEFEEILDGNNISEFVNKKMNNLNKEYCENDQILYCQNEIQNIMNNYKKGTN